MRNIHQEYLDAKVPQISFEMSLVFAAACCKRLLFYYGLFTKETGWGDYGILNDSLGIVWEFSYRHHSDVVIENAILQCEHVTPDTEDFTSKYTSAAMEAGNTVAMALEFCISRSDQLVVDIATSAIDSLSMIEENNAVQAVCQPYDSESPGLLATAEMNRQREDLDFLSALKEVDRAVIERFRNR